MTSLRLAQAAGRCGVMPERNDIDRYPSTSTLAAVYLTSRQTRELARGVRTVSQDRARGREASRARHPVPIEGAVGRTPGQSRAIKTIQSIPLHRVDRDCGDRGSCSRRDCHARLERPPDGPTEQNTMTAHAKSTVKIVSASSRSPRSSWLSWLSRPASSSPSRPRRHGDAHRRPVHHQRRRCPDEVYFAGFTGSNTHSKRRTAWGSALETVRWRRRFRRVPVRVCFPNRA